MANTADVVQLFTAKHAVYDRFIQCVGYTEPPIARSFDQRGATYVNWKSSRSGDEMLIEITAWNNPRAAYGTRYVLKRFNDQWFVVGTRGSWMA